MQEAPSRTFTWSAAITMAAIGGAAAVAGVFLGWWQADAYRTSEIFGREQVEVRMLLGTSHWSGAAAVVLGALVTIAALAGLVLSPEVRRVAAIAALGGGILILVAAALGFAQASGVAEAKVGGAGLGVDGSAAGGLCVSAIGGLVAAAGGFLAPQTVET